MKLTLKTFAFYLILLFAVSCGDDNIVVPPEPPIIDDDDDDGETDLIPVLSSIDLNNWKVTLPVGSPTEVEPPEILEYPSVEVLQNYMYDDPTDSALVFYTVPGQTTSNSSFSRTELREQMVPGDNNTNWTFADGGYMKGTLKMDSISGNPPSNYHETIIMQIHGRLTDDHLDDLGLSSNDKNAPPVLKIFWRNNKVKVERKVLADLSVEYPDILLKDAWDNEKITFDTEVNFDKFTLEVIVTAEKMEVILNEGEESVVFEDIHIEKWGIFENYFKAGNYLQTENEAGFAKVKYYALEVSH